MHTNQSGDTLNPNPHPIANDPENPGYEVTDVNVSGVLVFLSGLFGFVLIFFVVCFVLGRLINNELNREDGPTDKWHAAYGAAASGAGNVAPKKREDLTSNPTMEQREAQHVVETFPDPRPDVDDGNQTIADIHAREDLLLNHYSKSDDGTIRIPIEKAMELVAKRGLPVVAATNTDTNSAKMAGVQEVKITAPLTTGFARTGYEQDKIAERKQKMELEKEAAVDKK